MPISSMVLKICSVLLGLLMFGARPVLAFEMDGHYFFNYILAQEIGCFSKDEAALIAAADWAVDVNATTQPTRTDGNPQKSKDQLSGKEIKQKLHAFYAGEPGNRALQEKNLANRHQGEQGLDTGLVKFGQYLHFRQDELSHRGYAPTWGHAIDNIIGVSPDTLATYLPGKGILWLWGDKKDTNPRVLKDLTRQTLSDMREKCQLLERKSADTDDITEQPESLFNKLLYSLSEQSAHDWDAIWKWPEAPGRVTALFGHKTESNPEGITDAMREIWTANHAAMEEYLEAKHFLANRFLRNSLNPNPLLAPPPTSSGVPASSGMPMSVGPIPRFTRDIILYDENAEPIKIKSWIAPGAEAKVKKLLSYNFDLSNLVVTAYSFHSDPVYEIRFELRNLGPEPAARPDFLVTAWDVSELEKVQSELMETGESNDFVAHYLLTSEALPGEKFETLPSVILPDAKPHIIKVRFSVKRHTRQDFIMVELVRGMDLLIDADGRNNVVTTISPFPICDMNQDRIVDQQDIDELSEALTARPSYRGQERFQGSWMFEEYGARKAERQTTAPLDMPKDRVHDGKELLDKDKGPLSFKLDANHDGQGDWKDIQLCSAWRDRLK